MPFFNLRILFDFFWENDLKIKRGKERGTDFLKIENTVFCHYSVNSVTIFRMLSICIFPFLCLAERLKTYIYHIVTPVFQGFSS